MNKILIKILLVFLPFTNLIGQQYTNFNFTQSPNFQLTNSQKAQEELILEKKYSIEYVFENQHFVMYKYTYIARWVNSDKAIERNNKIYLSKNESASFVYQKARVIKPNGQISILKSEDIKEGKDEKSDYTYSYFALEGLEKASIIEFSSYEKTNPYYSGSIYYFQGSQKRYNQEFEIICPNHLEFAFKSLNNAPQIIVDTNLTEVNRWFIIVDSAQAITDKTYLYPDVVKMGILYKLDKNYNNNVKDITSYGPVSERIYTMINQAPSKSAKKKLNQINKELNLANINTDEEKIRLIEFECTQTYHIVNRLQS